MIKPRIIIAKAKDVSNIKNKWAYITLAALTAAACNVSFWPDKKLWSGITNNMSFDGPGYDLPLKMPSAIIVCREKQCAPAKLSMSAEYIYNSLLRLFQNNNHQTALICQGNASTHSCVETYVTMPITVGVTPAYAYIDSVKISDVTLKKGQKSINLLLNYNITYNGQSPTCTPAQSITFVKNEDNILLEDGGYNCKMTTIGTTSVKTLFAIDYIDLDYGFIGGFYSIGFSGPAYGGGSGYMILRLPKDAYPLTPELQAPAPKKEKKRFEVVTETTVSGNNDDSQETLYENVQIFPINTTK